MTPSRRSIDRRALVAAFVALALTVTACSSSSKKSAAPAAATTTTTVPATDPLTGLPVTDPAKAARPALVIKVENNPAARPQIGLDVADIVYEERAEGGISRFATVFHSTDVDKVGPVRSARPSDPGIVGWLNRPLFAYSGGSKAVLAVIAGAPFVDIGVDRLQETSRCAPAPYYRCPRPGRAVEHTLYSSTAALYAKAPAGGAPPPAFAQFLAPGQPFGGAGAVPATHITVAVDTSTVADYDWDAATSTWKRSTNGTPHVLEGGGQVAPTNVIVQFVPYTAFPGDPAKVVVAGMVGQGEAWFLSGGMLVKGRWSKPALTSVTTYTDAAGAPIRLVPGHTWVELPQVGVVPTVR